jgi:hypothetical protein
VKGRELAAIRQSTSMGTAFTRSHPTSHTSNPQSACSQQPAASNKASSKADNIGKVQQYTVVPEHCATKACHSLDSCSPQRAAQKFHVHLRQTQGKWPESKILRRSRLEMQSYGWSAPWKSTDAVGPVDTRAVYSTLVDQSPVDA